MDAPTFSYVGKRILAPMVRVGTLPMRLLALEYGADMVYGEEVIDLKMMTTKRVVNTQFGTIDYMPTRKDQPAAFRTCEKERGKVVFQMGTASPETALAAARVVYQDVAAIDVNCGCPKKFSTQGGMGSALLSDPQRLKSILTALVREIPIPITCKIRMLETKEATVDLVKMIESTGVSALAIHCRKVYERPRDPGHWEAFKLVSSSVSIPVIANGDIFSLEDARTVMQDYGVSSVMMARGAQWNPSIFREAGTVPVYDAAKRYAQIGYELGNAYQNSKYTLMQMITDHENGIGYELLKARSMRDIAVAFDDLKYFESVMHGKASTDSAANDSALPYIPHAPVIIRNPLSKSKAPMEESTKANGSSDVPEQEQEASSSAGSKRPRSPSAENTPDVVVKEARAVAS